MLTLPDPIIVVLTTFAPLFSRPVFENLLVVTVGSILTPGRRTVTAALRVMGLSECPCFHNFHRVFSRAHWSGLEAARLLLLALVAAFAPEGPLVVGIDETLERRQGEKIKKKAVYHDAVRSSKSFFVKSTGLRWIVLMLLAPVPWAGRVWALPFFCALACSRRYDQKRGRRHKTLSDWAGQMVACIRRWLPDRQIVLVADSAYAVMKFLDRCRKLDRPVTVVTRFRLDAALYDFAPAPTGKRGRPREKGDRLPTLMQVLFDPKTCWQTFRVTRWYSQHEREVEMVTGTCLWYHPGSPVIPVRWVLIRDPKGKFKSQALICTDLDASPEQIIAWFVQRWQLETTFEEVRAHLGVETQRQWSDLAIERQTPALLALFSVVVLLAKPYIERAGIRVRRAAWYPKRTATFSDTLALVRFHLWRETNISTSPPEMDRDEITLRLLDRMTDALCYAA